MRIIEAKARASMDAGVLRRRRHMAAGGAFALGLAVLCFAALTWEQGSDVPGALLAEELLTSTQRQERAIILKRRDDMAIRSAEARLTARMAKRPAANARPTIFHGPQLAKKEPLNWTPTPEALTREFKQYASAEKKIVARMANTENTINIIDQPALALTKQLKVLSDEHHHAPVQNPAVVVQPEAAPKEEERVRELSQIANKEREMVKRTETEETSLRQEVDNDTRANSHLQEALWKEEETVALLHRALARDVTLKQELAAKDKDLALKTLQLDRVEDELHAKYADSARVTPTKPESSQQIAQQKFKSVAHDERAIVQDMHLITEQTKKELATPVSVTHPDNALVGNPVMHIPGVVEHAAIHIPGVEEHVTRKSARKAEPAPVRAAGRANYDDGTGYMKAPARDGEEGAGKSFSVSRSYHGSTGYMAAGIQKRVLTHNRGTHAGRVQRAYDDSTGYLNHSAKRAARQHLAIKAQTVSAPTVYVKKETQAQVLSEANKDATSLSSTKAKLEKEMQSIEKSEDNALDHIRNKMQALDDDDSDYVHTLISEANKASPDDEHPTADEVKRNTPRHPLSVVEQAKTQLLVSKPNPAMPTAKAVHRKSAEHMPVPNKVVKAPKETQPPNPLHAAKQAPKSKAQHVERKSKGALSVNALKAVEDLAREGDDDTHKVRKPVAHVVKAEAAKMALAHTAVVHQPKKQKAKAAAKTAQALAKADHKAAPKAVPLPTKEPAASTTAEKTVPKSGANEPKHVEAATGAASKSTRQAKDQASKPPAQAKGKPAAQANKQVVAVGKAAAAKGTKAAAVGKGEINPMAEISMALRAEKLFNKIGNGHTHAHKPQAPAASTPATALAAAAATQKTSAHVAAAKKSSGSSSTSSSVTEKTKSSSNNEIDPLSVIEKAFAQAEKAHAAKLAAEQVRKKAELHAAAERRRANKTALAKLNAELHAKPTGKPTAAAPKQQQLAAASPGAKQTLAAKDNHQLKSDSKSAKEAHTAGKPGKAPTPAHAEMDPLAVIEQALVKAKIAKHSETPQQKSDDNDATAKPKPGSLLDLFGKTVAKSVGSLMDKVHRSEGRSQHVKTAKAKAPKVKMSEVEKLAKLIDTNDIKGAKGAVHTARMEIEIDASAPQQHAHTLPAHKAAKTLTPAATRLTKGQVQEQKDKQAEVDLESLYKKGRLVDNKKRALPAKQRVQQSKAVVLPARPLQSSKDVEAMRDLEKMHKLGLLQQHGAELRIGNNKMLQLFGKNAASQYSHDQGLLQNKELMQNVHDNTAHAQLKMTTEGAALAATANNFYSKWSNSI